MEEREGKGEEKEGDTTHKRLMHPTPSRRACAHAHARLETAVTPRHLLPHHISLQGIVHTPGLGD